MVVDSPALVDISTSHHHLKLWSIDTLATAQLRSFISVETIEDPDRFDLGIEIGRWN